MEETYTEEMLQFIRRSPSAFHAAAEMEGQLAEAGFTRLYEEEVWEIRPGGNYFVVRGDTALIAFRMPVAPAANFQITAAHGDSPVFKIKDRPEVRVDGRYVKLSVERYGGMLMAPWFDRPLSAAGRVFVRNGQSIRRKLVNMDRDLLLIPSLAIHMNREANEGYRYNPAVDMMPLYSLSPDGATLKNLIADVLGVREADILDADLFVYNRMPGTIWGANREFLSAPRLDDLQCAFGSLKALLSAKADPETTHVSVHAVFDNEEVGSLTRSGAASTFLKDTLMRIGRAAGKDSDGYMRMIAASFLISADNAHALHPNHPDKSDAVNRPYLNEGVVLKYSANQKYTTDALSGAVFREICRKAGQSCQVFANRSDMAGGSTLGNLSTAQVAIPSVDIGLAQLAMHSPYETAGSRDLESLIRILTTYYESDIRIGREGYSIY